ncbi:MAG: polyhydroxyalkanoate synthesis repressor PhaR [Bradymonadia bacterium]|jgi:polyhydroxyalkanoate synthesis repressor PhaR
MKLIKRYTNRKLYDTERSCYVTLDEIAEMVREGEDVRIVDNKSGEDLTTVTLAQIVYEEEKRNRKVLPLQSLRMIIQAPADFLQRISKPVTDFREETQRQVERFKERAATGPLEATPVRDFVDNIQRTIDGLGSQLDERIKESLGQLTDEPQVRSEVDALSERVNELERDMEAMRVELRALRADAGQRAMTKLPASGAGRLPSPRTESGLP